MADGQARVVAKTRRLSPTKMWENRGPGTCGQPPFWQCAAECCSMHYDAAPCCGEPQGTMLSPSFKGSAWGATLRRTSPLLTPSASLFCACQKEPDGRAITEQTIHPDKWYSVVMQESSAAAKYSTPATGFSNGVLIFLSLRICNLQEPVSAVAGTAECVETGDGPTQERLEGGLPKLVQGVFTHAKVAARSLGKSSCTFTYFIVAVLDMRHLFYFLLAGGVTEAAICALSPDKRTDVPSGCLLCLPKRWSLRRESCHNSHTQ